MVDLAGTDERDRTDLAAGRRTCASVLGMHRSGTSALAGVLSLLGVSCAAEPYGRRPNNPRGYSGSLFLCMTFTNDCSHPPAAGGTTGQTSIRTG